MCVTGSDEGDRPVATCESEGQTDAADARLSLASARDSFHSVDENFGDDGTPSPDGTFESPHEGAKASSAAATDSSGIEV